jgi:histidine triad (HIT) family protein
VTRFAPPGYDCLFCKVVRGEKHEELLSRPEDVFYRDEQVVGFVSTHWFPNNEGHALIIPASHYESIFDLPPEVAGHIHALSQKVAHAFLEVYNCEGISTRQHNGSAGYQEIFHYHLHVFPRYHGDNLYLTSNNRFYSDPVKRATYAKLLRDYFSKM